jgi:hypothetical protein
VTTLRRRQVLLQGLAVLAAGSPGCAADTVAPAPEHARLAQPPHGTAEASAEVSAPLHRLHTGDLGALAAVDARLGGLPWRCLVDSGASIALVSPAFAARLGLRVVERSRVATAGGPLQLDRVELPPLEVAGRRVDAPQALVLDLERQLGDVGAAVDGLIGAPALRRRVTRLELASAKVHWDLSAQRPTAAQARAVWPLRWEGGLPVIDLALGDRAPAPFLFDTGNAGSLVVFARHAARLMEGAQGLPTVTMLELGGRVSVHQVLVERLHAPGYLARDVPAAFESGGGARRGAHFDRLAGSVGLALFSDGAVTLDGPGGRLIVELPNLPEVPRLPGGFGLALRSQAGQAPVVAAVFEGGPAARAGVRPGRRLLALDGQDVSSWRASEVWRLLYGVERASFGFDALPAAVELARERFFERWR